MSLIDKQIYVDNSYRVAGHNCYIRDEIQKLAQLLSMYVSMELLNNSDDIEDKHFAYDMTYVDDIHKDQITCMYKKKSLNSLFK